MNPLQASIYEGKVRFRGFSHPSAEFRRWSTLTFHAYTQNSSRSRLVAALLPSKFLDLCVLAKQAPDVFGPRLPVPEVLLEARELLASHPRGLRDLRRALSPRLSASALPGAAVT